jgi:creatinine amidohydrolase
MKMENLTYLEVEEYLKIDKRLIIPVGTTEQHGKHLPLNTDTLIAEYIAGYLSREMGIIVAPTINYGVNLPCDRFFSGTATLRENTLRNAIKDIIEWWMLQGFEKFYVLSAHGDPFHLKALKASSSECISLLELFDFNMEDILEMQKSAKHACEAETSVMLYLFPDMVRKESIQDFETPFEVFEDYLFHKRDDKIEGYTGCQGYPSKGSREKGFLLIKKMKENAMNLILQN